MNNFLLISIIIILILLIQKKEGFKNNKTYLKNNLILNRLKKIKNNLKQVKSVYSGNEEKTKEINNSKNFYYNTNYLLNIIEKDIKFLKDMFF